MTLQGEYIPSAFQWVRDQVEAYERSGGREANTLRGPKSKQEFIDYLDRGGGLVYAGWCGDPAVEAEIKESTKATIRVVPDEEFRSSSPPERCIWTGQPAKLEVVWAKAY